MKPKFHSIVRLVLITVMIFTPMSFATQNKAPDFVIKDKQRLSDLTGKVVYVDFWASWCGPCRKSFPWMNKINKQYSSADFVVISVNLDEDIKAAKKFLGKYPAQFSVTYNPGGDIAEKYKVMGMPSSYLIDRNGNIAATHVGFFNKKIAGYEQQIEQLINQK
jgi:thiol-disulfide isomerase/thioredoxin